MIPEEIVKQIQDKAIETYQTTPLSNQIHRLNMSADRAIYTDGANFGYSLSIQTIEDKDKEIERLKGLLEKEFKNGRYFKTQLDESNEGWRQFEIENNL